MSEDTMESTELLSLTPLSVAPNHLFLDPNNPRLSHVDSAGLVPESAARDPEVQAATMQAIRGVGFQDITDKIKKLGFLQIDRIVVRELSSGSGDYLVLEGNRRVAAVKSLLESPLVFAQLGPDVQRSLDALPVLLYKGNDADIAWLVQGVRHIDSIKEWGPYQQAKFLEDLQQRRGTDIADIAAVAGLSKVRVVRLLRSYHAWLQARNDPERGNLVDESDFSVFQEAIFYKTESPIAAWLGWDDQRQSFMEAGRLGVLLSQLKDPVDGEGPRIARVNPDLRDWFAKLVVPGREAFLSEFLEGEKSLADAKSEVDLGTSFGQGQRNSTDLVVRLARLKELDTALLTLPLPLIVHSERRREYGDVLAGIHDHAASQLGVVKSADDAARLGASEG